MLNLSREELHRLVDACCDARDRSEAMNDPAQRLRLEAEAHALGDQCLVSMIGGIKIRRVGAALDARDVFDINALDNGSLAEHEFGRGLLNTKGGKSAARRMLARALYDCSWLPRWLVDLAVSDLMVANFGGETSWIGRAERPAGMSGFHASQTFLDAAIGTRVHYHAGYHDMRLDDAAVDVLADDSGKRWDSLQRSLRRLKLGAMCDHCRETGVSDRLADRPYNPNLAAHYDAQTLEDARRSLRKQNQRTNIV